jgi:RNA polymerase sigma-70 factor (ECF subfamily)
LYYYESYSIKEISKILHTNENTIKTRLSRARKELEKIIQGGISNE